MINRNHACITYRLRDIFTYSQADGGPEVGNLQDKQYHKSCYADEAQYGQGKKRHSENLGK